MRSRTFQRGFTAVEVLVVIAIIGIIAAFAAPAMTQLIRTQKVRGAAYDIFADLTYARSEAIARGHNIQVASVGGAGNWAGGWGIRDQTTGEVLRTQGTLSSGLSFTADAGTLTFDRSGRTSANVSFTLQPAPVNAALSDDQKRCVRLSASGRPASQNGLCPGGTFQ